MLELRVGDIGWAPQPDPWVFIVNAEPSESESNGLRLSRLECSVSAGAEAEAEMGEGEAARNVARRELDGGLAGIAVVDGDGEGGRGIDGGNGNESDAVTDSSWPPSAGVATSAS